MFNGVRILPSCSDLMCVYSPLQINNCDTIGVNAAAVQVADKDISDLLRKAAHYSHNQ